MGIVSALGCGVEQTYRALKQGVSGIGPIRYLDTQHKLPAAEVPLSDGELRALCCVAPEATITRTTLLGILALREAIAASGIDRVQGKRIAFVSGTTVGGMEKSEAFYLDFLENERHKEYIAVHDCGSCTHQIAESCRVKFHAITTCSTACSSATNAMILGAAMLECGTADIVVVGGSECLTKFHLNGFNTLMILDTEHCRPFCATRRGLNLGEGAAYLVMEREVEAVARGAEVLCLVSGWGNACDAYHQTASSPEGKGASLAMQHALNKASLAADRIDYINAHGTATPNNDESESSAIRSVFGPQTPWVSSTKAHTGHTTSAAGGVEAVVSILALQRSFVPPTLNHRSSDRMGLRLVTELMERTPLEHVMSNSFGFGGNNSSIIFSKCI